MHATNVLALMQERDKLRARVVELEARLTTRETVNAGSYSVDLVSGDVRDGDQRVARLTPTERQVLGVLAAAPGSPVRYEWIGETVWPGLERDAVKRAVAVNLCRIRAKIDNWPIEPSGNGSKSRHFRTIAEYGVAFLP